MPIIKARSSSIINSVDLRGTPTAATAAKRAAINSPFSEIAGFIIFFIKLIKIILFIQIFIFDWFC